MSLSVVTVITSEETYTFYPDDGSPEIHILSGRLREWLNANAMNRLMDLVFPHQELKDIEELHGLEAPRMKSMTEAEALEPVIVGDYPGGVHILIDGGHRRWYWANRGRNTLRGWRVPYEVWSDFIFDPATTLGLHHMDASLLPQRRGK